MWLGVSLVDFLTSISHFMQFKLLDVSMSLNLIFENVWIALVSEIRRHKIICIFKGGVIDHSEICP